MFVNLLVELDRYIGQPIYIDRYQGQADMIDWCIFILLSRESDDVLCFISHISHRCLPSIKYRLKQLP